MDKKRSKQPRKVSLRYLENAALHYLQRYATSAENLRRVLKRKIERSCKFHAADPAEFYAAADALIERYTSSGLLNDRVYAEAKVSSLRRRGLSRQAIAHKLQAKGLAKSEILAGLEITDAEKEEPELEAALALARRKKLGPFRPVPATDPDRKKKDMAALARAGFSYDIAAAALNFRPEEDE